MRRYAFGYSELPTVCQHKNLPHHYERHKKHSRIHHNNLYHILLFHLFFSQQPPWWLFASLGKQPFENLLNLHLQQPYLDQLQ